MLLTKLMFYRHNKTSVSLQEQNESVIFFLSSAPPHLLSHDEVEADLEF